MPGLCRYALLSCVSRVIGRHGEAALGKLHLNISGCPAPAAGAAASPVAASLQKLLSELLPLCGSLAISPGALNAAAFAPTKDHEANLLRPGALQLPMGSTLLLDEAMMTAGRLDARGIENIKAVEKLLDSQKLGFDFTYFQVNPDPNLTPTPTSTLTPTLTLTPTPNPGPNLHPNPIIQTLALTPRTYSEPGPGPGADPDPERILTRARTRWTSPRTSLCCASLAPRRCSPSRAGSPYKSSRRRRPCRPSWRMPSG